MFISHENKIKVHNGNEIRTLLLGKGQSLLEGLLREGYGMRAVCGGAGRCGKCKVRVLEGEAPVTGDDKRIFSPKELAEGWRLSCKLYPKGDLSIFFDWNAESDFDVVSDYAEVHHATAENAAQKEYNIAIDIGTTTIVLQLLDKTTGEIQSTVSAVNSQRNYGADVISRIQASVDGKKEELRRLIRENLKVGIQSLLKACDIAVEQIARIAIGCNTTMGHLLMGYDCNGLGAYPFTPVNISLIKGTASEILGMWGDTEVLLLPGISTYVGGDIVAGLYACDFDKSDDICLLVDLGTNGEMALGNREKILVASAAAGPAFEGGNITHGMGSVAGAICSVKLEGFRAKVQTIREKAPVGICGTGVVEAIAELLRENLLDETGLLHEDYFDAGFLLAETPDGKQIVITQKDIRELQLAKAAIRAGVEILLLRYGIQKEQVSRIYLAGGFGYKLDVEKAIAIGMLPEEFAGRIQAVGNSCLAGTVKYLTDGQGEEALRKMIQISDEIILSADDAFNETYMDCMMFKD